MRKFLPLLLCVFLLISLTKIVNSAVVGTSNYPDMSKPLKYSEYNDIPAPNKKEGWRKLEGHELGDFYIIYFKTGKGLTPGITIQTEIVPVTNLDMDEIIKGSYPDGRENYQKRSWWYNTFKMNFTESDYYKETFPDIYNEWFCLYSGKDAERVLRNYMHKIYMPKNYPGETKYSI